MDTKSNGSSRLPWLSISILGQAKETEVKFWPVFRVSGIKLDTAGKGLLQSPTSCTGQFITSDGGGAMPTGYTSDIYNGKDVTFEQFTMGCARAFGALFSMRDEPSDAEIPVAFIPSAYYEENLDKAVNRQAKVEGWTEDQATRYARDKHLKAVRLIEKSIIENKAMVERHDAMAEQVHAWTPPTSGHQELKTFMLQQLRISSEYERTWTPSEPVELSGAEYKQQELDNSAQEIGRAKESQQSEVDRCTSRTEWVQALRKSLT